MKQFFVTATDTDAGKTFVSCALIYALQQQIIKAKNKPMIVAAFKPISAGCELVNDQLINEDAKLLSQFANAKQSIAMINPITFKDPIAPHIAAKKENVSLSISEIELHYNVVKALNADVIIVEGAGGWRLPLGVSPKINSLVKCVGDNKQSYQFLSDFAKRSQHDVILIINMKLGCLNHALLTFEAIKTDGLNCIAWVANCASSESMNNLAENITELEQLLPIPKIAQFDFFNDVDKEGNHISFKEKIKFAASQINLAPLLT
ncbi:MAG: dethiobiotin synthase [Colwellia sp.]